MTLFQKGVLLIAIPLLGQFVFVMVLIGAYRASEELAWKDAHYRTETQELMGMSLHFYKAVAMLSAYGMSGEESWLSGFDVQYEQLTRKMELLTLLEREQASKSSKEALTSLQKTLAALVNARQVIDATRGATGPTGASLVDELKADGEDSLTRLEELIVERSKVGATKAEELAHSRSMFLFCVIAGFAVNILFSAAVLFVYANRFAGRFGVIVDNTKRLAGGQELNAILDGRDELHDLDQVFHEMNDALKEAEARKQQFLQMVSHDMRSPLTSVQLTLELASTQFFGPVAPEAVARLDESDKLVKRLTRLINDILDFDKIRAGRFDMELNVVDLNNILEASMTELKPIAARSNVELRLISEPQQVIADAERVTQIVINLVANSIKFSPRGQVVAVTTKLEGEFVHVSVADSGSGIPEEFREKIFLPFEQVPDSGMNKVGTGLGLAICKMLVELQGGKIGLESPQRGGTVFWFTLPAAVVEEL